MPCLRRPGPCTSQRFRRGYQHGEIQNELGESVARHENHSGLSKAATRYAKRDRDHQWVSSTPVIGAAPSADRTVRLAPTLSAQRRGESSHDKSFMNKTSVRVFIGDPTRGRIKTDLRLPARISDCVKTVSRSGSVDREPIADALLGQQVTRLSGISFDLASQARHEDARVVRFIEMMRAPNFIEQMAMRQHLAGVVYQCREQFVLDRREMESAVADEDLTLREVKCVGRRPERSWDSDRCHFAGHGEGRRGCASNSPVLKGLVR